MYKNNPKIKEILGDCFIDIIVFFSDFLDEIEKYHGSEFIFVTDKIFVNDKTLEILKVEEDKIEVLGKICGRKIRAVDENKSNIFGEVTNTLAGKTYKDIDDDTILLLMFESGSESTKEKIRASVDDDHCLKNYMIEV